MKVNSYRSLSSLFYHNSLLEEIVKSNEKPGYENGLTDNELRNIRQKYISDYRNSMSDSIRKTEEEINNINNVLDPQNLKENNIMYYNDVSKKSLIMPEILALVKKMRHEKSNFLDSTLNKHELAIELKNLNEYIKLLEGFEQVKSEQEKKDAISLVYNNIQDIFFKIKDNNQLLNDAITFFINDISSKNKKVSKEVRIKSAEELKEHRVTPFQNFLLYSEDLEDNSKTVKVSDLIEKIAKGFSKINQNEISIIINNYNLIIKKINENIVKKSGKLNNIIKSNKKRLQMLEWSNSKLEELYSQIREQEGYKTKNRNLHDLKAIKKFKYIENISNKFNTRYGYQDIHFLLNDPIDLINELLEEKIDINNNEQVNFEKINENIEKKKLAIKKYQENEKNKDEIRFRKYKWIDLKSEKMTEFLNSEEVDLYKIIEEDVNNNCNIPEGFLNENMLYAILKSCLENLNKYHGIYYNVIERREDSFKNKRPIFKFYKKEDGVK